MSGKCFNFNEGRSESIRTIEEMRVLFKQRGYNLLSDEYVGNKSPLVFEKDGYKYQNTYNGFIKTDNPKKWGVNNPFSMSNLALWLKMEGATCELLSDKYDIKNVALRCECGEIYHISMSNLINKRQFKCPKCGRLSSSQKHNQKDRFMKAIESKGLRIIGEYSTAKKHYYMITHDGYYIKASPWNIEAGLNERDTIFDVCNKYSFNNMQHWLDDNNVDLQILSKEYSGTKARYMFRCSCGNVFSETWQYITSGCCTRCPSCSKSMSSLELKTREWLDENGICYIQQKTFGGCRDKGLLRFDFYLPYYDVLIEVDGPQHFNSKISWKRTEEEAVKSYESLKRRDAIKDRFCLDTNRRLLRIPYWEYETNQYRETLKAFTAKI